MEAEVEDGVFDDLVVVVDLLEVVEGGLLDEIVALDPVNRVEEGYFECKYVER